MTSCLLQKMELQRLTSHKEDGLGRTLTLARHLKQQHCGVRGDFGGMSL
jgi:hypothetical protein